MPDWVADLSQLDEPVVLVTVLWVRGSAPREVGAKMIVTARETIGTIGGGRLEFECTRIATEQLKNQESRAPVHLSRRFALGANCGQCCGGVVDVLFEKLPGQSPQWLPILSDWHDERVPVVVVTSTEGAAKCLVTADRIATFDDGDRCPEAILAAAKSMLAGEDQATAVEGYLLEPLRPVTFNIAVFGAGHVGAATVDVLSRLECNIRWIDSRRNILPRSLPANVCAIETADPAREVLAMPAGSLFLVMTHSHPLDQEICAQVLHRNDFAYCGLIGSRSKRRRFERLWKKQGLAQSQLGRLVCPIGVPGVLGRTPVDIAIAVAAEILQVRDARLAGACPQDGEEDHLHAI